MDAVISNPVADRFSFGKHSGKTFGEVAGTDAGYCSWARENQNPTGQLRDFINFLAQRASDSTCPTSSTNSKRSVEVLGSVANNDAKRQRMDLHQDVQAVARPSVAQRRFFRLQHQYLEHIRSGRKRWEGRLNVGAAANVSAGCIATFDSGREKIEMLVESVKQYRSFEDMLLDLGVDTCLPGVTSLTQGTGIYHSFPGYAEKASKLGVTAMELRRPDSI